LAGEQKHGSRLTVDLTVQGDGNPAIRVRGLVRRFGGTTALDGIDLTVPPGSVHALLGPNGAGKTTLTRILSGLADPDGGTVETFGAVGLVPSGDRTFYLRLSGLENLIFFGRLQGLRLRAARSRAREVLDDVGLSDAATVPVGRYSHGMQKRLSVARALLVDPSVLLVDEATHDLDPAGASRIRALISQLTDRGTAVLWATQRVEEIRGFAHAVTFLHRGAVAFTGSVSELIAHGLTQRYVLTVRNGNPDHPPDASRLQRALGATARVSDGPGEPGHFLMAPGHDATLGAAIATLTESGFEVSGCRQERAEIEAAFLALSAESTS
jgi:ABC-type multidrug transport system ATPase subunit